MLDYLSILNEKQYEAVTTTQKNARVIAGAGSGKTRVLTSRIAYLISHENANPRRILAITFTNKAAKEMKTRVEKILEVESCPTVISTYHSFCARLLREDISKLGYTRFFTIIDEEDQKKVVKEVKQDIDRYKLFKPDQLLGFISNVKTFGDFVGDDLDPNSEMGIKYRIYLAYEKYLKDNNYLDFDDLILKTVEILKKFPEVKHKWQERFDHVLIDEFQDTNDIEYNLVKMLMKEDTTFYVVGDPDQTIYTWRGANLDIILNFKKDFKDTKDYILDTNYRSTQEILNAANTLIKNNKDRLSKDLFAHGKAGPKPVVYAAFNNESESEYIAKTIKELKNGFENISYKDIAIFYRSNYYSKAIEEQLIRLRIPYTIYGAVRFYERKEIKDALAYLRLICDDKDVLAFSRIINVPSRKVGDVTMQRIMDGSEEKSISPYQYVKEKYEDTTSELGKFVKIIEDYKKRIDLENNPKFGEILKDLLEETGYIYTIDKDDEEERLENLSALESYLFDTQVKNEGISLKEILQDIALYSAQDEISNKNTVSLMTVHTAKGLEFPVVFVAGLSECVFPSKRACESESKSYKAMEEERRLCYVAYTRAMNKLYLTYNTGYDFASDTNKSISRFLLESSEYLNMTRKPSGSYGSRYNDDYSLDSYAIKPNKKEIIVEKEEENLNITSDTEIRPGMMVIHPSFGEGIVLQVNSSIIEIAFMNPSVGNKKISRKYSGLKKKGK